MTTVAITEATLRVVRLALYQLRQDVGVPETPQDAADDATLTWSKCRDAASLAFDEVLDAHNWTWKRGASETASVLDRPDAWPADALNALVYCLARELAVPVAGRVEDMRNCHQLYQQKLAAARLHDLEKEVAAVEDLDVREVLAAVFPTLLSGQANLPADLLSVTRRIEANAAHARAAVLASHNWSFARAEEHTACPFMRRDDALHPFACTVPARCARVLAVYTACGTDADWKIEGREIVSDAPVAAVAFIRDEDRLDRWPPLVRAAYCARLAADIAAAVAGSAAEAERLRAEAERRLADAKLADSRASGSRREVYGNNFYADMMRGGTFRRPGGGAPWRW